MALAYVLWIVALLTLLAGGLQVSVKNQLLLSRNLVDQVRAEALAEGAIELAMADLSRRTPDDVRLGARTIRLPTGEARVTITDLGGLIDINAARPDLLERALQAAGAEPDLAADLARRIVARRQASASANGRGSILLLDELLQMPGVSPALFQQFAGLMTTQGGHQIVDPGVASPAAILALANLDSTKMETYLAERAERGRFAPLASPDAGPMIGAGFEIRAEVLSANGDRVTRIAVVKPARLGAAGQGLRLVDWRRERAG